MSHLCPTYVPLMYNLCPTYVQLVSHSCPTYVHPVSNLCPTYMKLCQGVRVSVSWPSLLSCALWVRVACLMSDQITTQKEEQHKYLVLAAFGRLHKGLCVWTGVQYRGPWAHVCWFQECSIPHNLLFFLSFHSQEEHHTPILPEFLQLGSPLNLFV